MAGTRSRRPEEILPELLRSLGAPDEEVRSAEARGMLTTLAAERLILASPGRYSRREVAERSGFELDRARTFWRALGLPEAGEDERIFTEDDAAALERLRGLGELVERIGTDIDVDELIIPFARVLGLSLSRLAATEIELIRQALARIAVSAEGTKRTFDPERYKALFEIVGPYLSGMAETLDYVHRRHLFSAAIRDLVGAPPAEEETPPVTIGFADMVGFTALTQRTDGRHLAEVVSRFTQEAHDVAARLGGRIVKTIGDEVMFAARDTEGAARIALELAETFHSDEEAPQIRIGLARGRAILHEGDFFGPAVNLASRLVNVALPDTVLVSSSVAEDLEGNEAFLLKQLRPQKFKGLGRLSVSVLRRPDESLRKRRRERK